MGITITTRNSQPKDRFTTIAEKNNFQAEK